MVVYAGDFGKVLCTVSSAAALLGAVKKALNRGEDVVIDFTRVHGVGIGWAKRIFRRLYIELGADNFHERVFLLNITERDYKTIRKSLISF